MKTIFKRISRNQKGQTATEYMLIVAVLVTVVIAAASMFGTDVKGAIGRLSAKVTTQMDSAVSCPAGSTGC